MVSPMKMSCLCVLALVSVPFIQATYADVFYVAPDGSATPPFNSWFSAATDLQVAIELAAETAGGPHQVWVKKGVYKPQFNPHSETDPVPREYCFALRNNIGVYGGFAGAETALEQRDPATNQTILSGDRGIGDTWADGTSIVDGYGVFNPPPTGDPSQDLPVLNSSTNCYHAIYNPLQTPIIDASAILDGFIVTGGNANGSGSNANGGGMYNILSSPALTNCIFSGNSALDDGGGMRCYLGSPPTLANCAFFGNSAMRDGGGMQCYIGSPPTLTDCAFFGNSAMRDGGGMQCYIGSPPTLADCAFSGNSAMRDGGGMQCYVASPPTLSDCAFSSNSATRDGGGMQCYVASPPTLADCAFFGNSATRDGGGMQCYVASPPTLANCTFSGNSTIGDGGGMHSYLESPPALTNCTFNSNSAQTGGGIYGPGVMATSSIFWDDSGGEFSSCTDFSNIRYSISSGSISGFGPGCSNSDPLLGDFGYYGGVTNCCPISSGSPAIDAGASVYRVASDNNILIYLVPGSDPAQYFKIADGTEYDPTGLTLQSVNSQDQRGYIRTERVDIGSYEYGAVPIPTSNLIDDSGDYNGDGSSDIAIFRDSSGLWSIRNLTRIHFGTASDFSAPADYNGDGTTDIAVFRPNSGLWAIRNMSRFHTGKIGDVPVPGDYNGDAIAEAGLFRGSSGLWAISNLTRVYFGSGGDAAAPGYYDTDAAKDIAIFRPSTGMWAGRDLTRFYFGSGADYLVPGDYNGDGKWQGGIFRPSSGLWSIRNTTRICLEGASYKPAPADYNGDGIDDAGIFRDSTGMWSVRDLTRVHFGSTGDIPVTR